jgi:hypothetical protein
MRVDTSAPPERLSAPAPSARRRVLSNWVDRVLGSDPGQTRLISALQATAAVAGAMLAEFLFVRVTHALQIDAQGAALRPAQAAAVAAQHHGVLVLAIMLGTLAGIVASFTAALFATPRARLENFAVLPVPMVAGLTLGLSLAPYRVLALASLVGVLTVGAYLRRFGPRGLVVGLVLFMGDLFGFLTSRELHLADLGWLTAEIVIGVLVATIAQFTLFYPSRPAALRRMRRSYMVRAREVANAASSLVQYPANPARRSRRLHRRLVRLNEAALMIDAQLDHPGALPAGWSATVLHQRLFDSELALANMARFAERLADLPLPAEIHELARQALACVGELDVLRAELTAHELLARLRAQRTGHELDRDSHIVLHRFAVSTLGFTEAVQGWRAESSGTDSAATSEETADSFQPAVMLMGGWLPGSATVSAAASLETRHSPAGGWRLRAHLRRWDRVRLAPHSRVAVQMGVAVTAAVLLGDLVSGRRFYWAVLAAFITFMGTNNAGEQLRKGFLRIAGTVVGVLLGAVGAHLVGNRTDIAIPVILASLFIGLYLIRISYAFLTVAITILVSQLYVQLDEFTNSLLVVRLAETALGAGVAALTVLCVLPLRTGRVARVAARHFLQALGEITEQATHQLANGGSRSDLRAAGRRLDAAYQAFVATMKPLGIPFVGIADSPRERLLHTAAASRHYARNLLTTIATIADIDLTPPAREQLEAAKQRLAESLDELIEHLQDSDTMSRSYVRSAALFDVVATRLEDDDYLAPAQLALRDLQLIDGAMATFAQTLGLTVHALDTDRQASHLPQPCPGTIR